MKSKPLKMTLIAVAAFIAVFVITAAVLFSEVRMNPLPTGRVDGDVFALKGKMANMFLIGKPGHYVAIDADDDRAIVERELLQLKIAPAEVRAVFLTHSDRDHVGALSLFPNARVYLSKDEVPMITGVKSRFVFMHNSIPGAYTGLSDGERIVADGADVTAITTPGHTPGSMSYLVEGRYLFTGDTLALKDGHVTLFFKVFNMDEKAEGASIGKLRAYSHAAFLFTAHTGMSSHVEDAFAKMTLER
jgi:glyoxylase-like metal-dependent hydrolase (beta-lactamase superfamily II)